MIKTRWIEFTWDLGKLPETAPELPGRLTLQEAQDATVATLQGVYFRAMHMEHGWGHDLQPWLQYTSQLMGKNLVAGEMDVLFVKDGARIIAVSTMMPKVESGYHLLPGIAVINEYGSRGIGAHLLYESLRRLREKGVEKPKSVSKKGTIAERYLYRKFHGHAVDVSADFSPLLATKKSRRG